MENVIQPDSSHPITVSIARTHEEKMAVYRFRYQVYIEELALKLDHADHKQKMIVDELDKNGFVIYAQAGGAIVGTQRLNIGTINDFPPTLSTLLSWERFQSCYGGKKVPILSYTSKLMVANHYRNTPVLHLITSKGYELYCLHGVQFNFGACNFQILRLYEQFGCRRYGHSFVSEDFDGIVNPVVLVVDDIHHLRAVRSPFYRLARRMETKASSLSDWFYTEFSEYSDQTNSQLISQETLWNYLYTRLGNRLTCGLTLLKGIAISDAKLFLHSCGILVKFRSGAQITMQNCISHTYKILVSGQLKFSTDSLSNKIIHPGESFGTSGLMRPDKYRENVFALTDSEVFIISRLSFERYCSSHAKIASQIICNLEEESISV